MRKFHRVVLLAALAFVQMTMSFQRVEARELRLEAKSVIRSGAYPWYEVKVDPEDSRNLIICGTKLDTLMDSLFGFVYVSGDGGKTWKTALEDRNSLWVTEQSCAFGPKHRAYFVSEASKVNNGKPEHEQGTTRLYVSADGGQTWTATIKTGWADYSTSVVSLASGKLYTFFNTIAGERGRTWGSNVGLLAFSSDGTTIEGPYFDSTMQYLDYDGTFPSGAVSLNNGTVAALYYGTRANSIGSEADLGVLRAKVSKETVSVEHTRILHVSSTDCLNLNDTSLAYDRSSGRLFAVYVEGCRDRNITLVSSDDDGRTWTHSPLASYRDAANPSLVVGSGGILNLLWEDGEGSGRWLFSSIQNQKLVESAIELSTGWEKALASSDSILTWIYQPNEKHSGKPSESSITISVVNMMNIVWRGVGAVTMGNDILVVWPSGDSSGTQLHSAILGPATMVQTPENTSPSGESDVTDDMAILYGGKEQFDPTSGKLDVCLKLGNRGSYPIHTPIKLEGEEIESPLGAISILNATNGRSGVGAIWDVSYAVTGIRVPPLCTTNSFCLSFRLTLPPGRTRLEPSTPGDLLVLRLRIRASKENPEQH